MKRHWYHDDVSLDEWGLHSHQWRVPETSWWPFASLMRHVAWAPELPDRVPHLPDGALYSALSSVPREQSGYPAALQRARRRALLVPREQSGCPAALQRARRRALLVPREQSGYPAALQRARRRALLVPRDQSGYPAALQRARRHASLM